MAQTKQHVEIEGRQIALSNLEKLLYPVAHFNKGQVIDYYARIAPYLLPHLQDRPITMKRFPDGVRGESFYEKNAPAFTPKWVQTLSVPRRSDSSKIRYILINDLPTLVWLANLASLEIHPFLHRAPHIDRPTSIVFDLDPGEGSDLLTCIKVALLVRGILNDLGLKSFAKVSGSKGLQMYVPLNGAVTYKITQPFAKAVAELLAARHPDEIVSEMSKHLRPGKVFIDWSQNSDFKTTVGVYSLRAKSDQPFVSLPVDWDELQVALKKKNAADLYLQPDEVIKRVTEIGDLFEPVLSLEQNLPRDVMDQLGSAGESKASGGGSASRSMDTYRRKRDFSKTPEPDPSKPQRSRQGGRRKFVIQKHAASRLHYDFRLEMNDALKSWAVPKGPPYTQKDKRLAMPTEDHPMGYLDFEGIIPKGQYGGGTVMVWDIGTYELMEGNYYKGHLHIRLEGSKLKGEWVLTRSRVEEGERERWYLIKTGESMNAFTPEEDDRSALTQRTMVEIAQSADAEWESNRPAKASSKTSGRQRKAEPNRA